MSEHAARERDFYNRVGRALRNYRQQRNLSQKAVATLVGVSFQQIQKYENGSNRPPLAQTIVLCQAFGITLQDLLETADAVKLTEQESAA